MYCRYKASNIFSPAKIVVWGFVFALSQATRLLFGMLCTTGQILTRTHIARQKHCCNRSSTFEQHLRHIFIQCRI